MSRPPHEESFELELEDAFTRMLVSRETPSSNNLSPQYVSRCLYYSLLFMLFAGPKYLCTTLGLKTQRL